MVGKFVFNAGLAFIALYLLTMWIWTKLFWLEKRRLNITFYNFLVAMFWVKITIPEFLDVNEPRVNNREFINRLLKFGMWLFPISLILVLLGGILMAVLDPRVIDTIPSR